jgi:hypothetical protein
VREQAILALLTERTLPRATARCGVSGRTLRRWQTEDAEFKAEYEAARTATFQTGISRIQTLVGQAVNTLEDLLRATESPSVRLGGARNLHVPLTSVRRRKNVVERGSTIGSQQ